MSPKKSDSNFLLYQVDTSLFVSSLSRSPCIDFPLGGCYERGNITRQSEGTMVEEMLASA